MANLFHRYLHTISSKKPLPPSSKSTTLTYLTETLGFPKPRALLFFNRFSSKETDPQSVIAFLTSLGFTKPDIQTWVTQSPQILFANPKKTLKPRIHFFQELGLTGSDLSKFISKNPGYLSNRFERLKPCIDIVKKLMTTNGYGNENLVRLLKRCNWVDVKEPVTRVSVNIKYLEQCGIIGSQLVTVITRQPRLLIMGQPEIQELVNKALEFGIPIDSRMFVHALYSVSCLNHETVEKKIELFQSFGFSRLEFLDMFKRAPGLLRVSEAKVKDGIEFFLNTVGFEKEVLVRRPTCLMLSLEDRVIPRYNVLDFMMAKKVLKKRPKFLNVMWIPEEEFMEKYISKNVDFAEELLRVYKGSDLIMPKE